MSFSSLQRQQDSEGTSTGSGGRTQFALDLYSRLRTEKGDFVFSPESIATALEMVRAGARGQTAEQISGVLHLQRESVPRPGNTPTPPQGCELYQANALWAQKDHSLLADYLALVREAFGAELRSVDFQRASAHARGVINSWVAEQTKGKIQDLLAPGVLNESTRLVLTNAVYFKGAWSRQFDKGLTREDLFHVSSTETMRVPMMFQESDVGYAENGDFQTLELKYQGNEVSFVVLLPRTVDGLAALEQRITTAQLEKCLHELRRTKLWLFLPRLRVTRDFSLSQTVSKMGMPLAFLPGKADFSGMDGGQDLYLSTVVHKAFIDVNEQGTEAAAATGAAMKFTAVQQ